MKSLPKFVEHSAQKIWNHSNQNTFFAQYFKVRPSQKKEIANLKKEVESLLKKYNKKLKVKGLTQKTSIIKKDDSLFFKEEKFKKDKFTFLRQKEKPYLCLSDFLKEKDSITLFILSIDKEIQKEAKTMQLENEFLKSHLLLTLSLFLVDQAAMQLPFKGKRYSFGHSSCPGLENQKILFNILNVKKYLDISLTESYMMIPESSVSGIIINNPKAKYFTAAPKVQRKV